MSETHLRRRFFGRMIRPVAFFLMLSLLVMVWATTWNMRGGLNLLGLPGDIVEMCQLGSNDEFYA